MPNRLTFARLVDTRASTAAGYLGTLLLSTANGYVAQGLQIDTPEVRAATESWSNRDGTNDVTQFFGARAVTLTVAFYPEAAGSTEQVLRDRLCAFLHPALRPRLEYQLEGADEIRSIQVRYGQGATFTQNFTDPEFSGMAVGWIVPSGLIETTTELSFAVAPATDVPELGRSYNLSFDRTYPTQQFPGGVVINNPGTVPLSPTLLIYGPCTNPVVENRTVGKKLEFDANGGVSLLTGEYIEVSMTNRTAYRNGDPTVSLLNRLDYTTSEWWTISAGSNVIYYKPASYTAGSQVFVKFRPAYF